MNITGAYFTQQDNIQQIIEILFIQGYGVCQFLERKAAFIRQPVTLQYIQDTLGSTGSSQTLFLSKLGNLKHADGYCLPVTFPLVVEMLFNCVSKGMPKIQKHTLSGVILVILYNHPFDVYTAQDDGRQLFLQFFERTV